LVILNANIVDVYSGDIYSGSIAIKSNRIIGVGKVDGLIGNSTIKVNIDGNYICPGFIDAHLHVESSMITLSEFAKAVLPHGTTTIIIDPHEIANVLGVDGIKMLIEESKRIPLDVYFTVPSCVPAAPGLDTSGAELNVEDIEDLLKLPNVVGLGEVMDFPGVLNGNEILLKKIFLAHSLGKRVDGHAPSLTGDALQRYISVGISSDHECISGIEAFEKLRFGMWIMVREGSISKNLSEILSFLFKVDVDTHRIMFVTDDINPIDVLKYHINGLVRMAIEIGFDPIDAIRMATLNPATYYRLDHEIGAVAPGLKANLIVLGDLDKVDVKMTIANGRVVASNGKLITQIDRWFYPIKAYKSINVKRIPCGDDFKFKVNLDYGRAIVRVIDVEDGSLYTKQSFIELPIFNGVVNVDVENDVLQVAVIERHKATGNIGLGFVRGFGLKRGSLASSISHDSHNIIVVGVNSSDMAYAVRKIIELGGGIAIVKDNSLLGCLPLPIAGLMSDEDVYSVSNKLLELNKIVMDIGCKLKEPFMTLSFIALPVIPELKITDKGLIWHNTDTGRMEFVNPIVEFK
ncbi:MAG: adenine deaminase, partial [Candidatus Methanomethylicia archaeon]